MPVLPLMHPTRRFLGSSRSAGEVLVRSAVGYWDAALHDGTQVLKNYGTAGSALNAQIGSSTSPDSNDPLWLQYTGTAYAYLTGVSGNTLSCPDESALDITGDIDIRVKVAMDDWTPAANSVLVSKLAGALASSYQFTLLTTGLLRFSWSLLGTVVINSDSTVAPTVADGAVIWVRVTRNATTGAVNFYTSADGVTWTLLSAGSDSTTGSMFASTANLFIGADSSGASLSAGKFYYIQILNGVDGPPVLTVDCSVVTGDLASFTATTGQTVTVNRSAAGRKTALVGTSGNRFLFGTDDYMEVADNVLLDVALGEVITVMAVMREWNTGVNGGRYVGKLGPGAVPNQGWMLRNDGATVNSRFDVIDATTQLSASAPTGTAGVLAVPGFTFTRINPGGIAYLNGVAGGTPFDATAVGDLSNALPMRFGCRSDSVAAVVDMTLIAVIVDKRVWTPAEMVTAANYFLNRRF